MEGANEMHINENAGTRAEVRQPELSAVDKGVTVPGTAIELEDEKRIWRQKRACSWDDWLSPLLNRLKLQDSQSEKAASPKLSLMRSFHAILTTVISSKLKVLAHCVEPEIMSSSQYSFELFAQDVNDTVQLLIYHATNFDSDTEYDIEKIY
jgi:hypothetical protein